MTPDALRIAAYGPDDFGAWNAFVAQSRNGTFLHDRRYMDYHSDRFEDASLVVREGDRIAALLPACRREDLLLSHAGLTYGGWITDQRMTVSGMLRCFELLRGWSASVGLTRLRYKAIPWCYHRSPADEDLYALFVHGAALVRQDVSTVIDLTGPPRWASGRRYAFKKAQRLGVEVRISDDLADFHAALSEVLEAHGVRPTHSLSELGLLKGRFPDQIRLYAAETEAAAIAYALVYDCGQTVHTQYLASRAAGRAHGGLDAIVARLQEDFADRRYLSFGVSTEADGRTLNAGLIAQKEMFGGRAMVCSTYDLALDQGAGALSR